MTKRFSHGLQFQSAFTWAKSIDNNSLISSDFAYGSGTVSNAQPPGDNTKQNQWGISDWDRPYRSTTAFVYELPNPLRNQGALLKKAFGGWQTSAVMTFQSGNPATFGVNVGSSAVKLQGFLTPDFAPGATFDSIRGQGPTEQRLNGYYNTGGVASATSAFATPPPLGYGTSGRGLPIFSPGQKSIDFSVAKRTIIRESMNLEFRAEFFNLFNWVSFGRPDSNVNDPGFGFIRSTTVAPRIIQFALKLNF